MGEISHMRGRFQSRCAAAALLMSTVPTLAGAPALAQQAGANVRGLTGQDQRPGPPPAPRDPNLITNPAWAVRPTPVFPEAAARTVQRGRVTLACFALPTGFMRDCQVRSETPEGLGFGASALIAARTARISQQGLAGSNPGAKVLFTVGFTLPPELRSPLHDPTTRPPDVIMDPPSEPRMPSVITNPSWAVQPMPEYPETAMAAGVVQGRVVQRCIVLSTGWLRNCEIIEETPTGMGFGASALNASATARITPRTVNGNAEAAMVQFAIRYEAPPALPIAPIRR